MLDAKKPQGGIRIHPNTLALAGSSLGRRGIGNLNAELYKKLYFATSSSSALPNHTVNQADLRSAANPSMKSLHQRAAPVQSQAPGAQRAHCTYSMEYQPLSLDGAPVLNELRHIIASNSRKGSEQNQVIEGLPFSSATTNKAFYGCYGDVPVRQEVATIVKPEPYMRINHQAKFLESKSCFQRDFRSHEDAGTNFNRRVVPAKSHDHLDNKTPGKVEDMTSYKRQFGRDRPPRYPGLMKSQSMPMDALSALQAQKAREAAAFSGRN